MNPSSLPQISILIPAYNEIGTIAEIIDMVATSLPGVRKEIVIVDDGSRDGTRDWLSNRYKATPEQDFIKGRESSVAAISDECDIRAIFHTSNKGKGGAIQTAMRAATGAVLIIQDADLEYDPGDWVEMYRLIAVKKVADVVYGSRFYGKSHRSLYFHHYLANRLDFGYLQHPLQPDADRYRNLLQDVHAGGPELSEHHGQRFRHGGSDQLPDRAGPQMACLRDGDPLLWKNLPGRQKDRLERRSEGALVPGALRVSPGN